MICLLLLSERTGKKEGGKKPKHQIHSMSKRSIWWQDASVQIRAGARVGHRQKSRTFGGASSNRDLQGVFEE